MANFAFSNSPAFNGKNAAPAIPTPAQLDEQFNLPSPTNDQLERMSYEDTIAKTATAFAVLVAGAAIGWFLSFLLIPAAIVGFVLALVTTFKKQPSTRSRADLRGSRRESSSAVSRRSTRPCGTASCQWPSSAPSASSPSRSPCSRAARCAPRPARQRSSWLRSSATWPSRS